MLIGLGLVKVENAPPRRVSKKFGEGLLTDVRGSDQATCYTGEYYS